MKLLLGNKSVFYEINSNDCWNVVGKYLMGNGYTKVYVFGKNQLTHRVVYAMLVLGVNEISSEIKVLHKCDNPRCINPNHLISGTQTDNMADMDNKRRRVPPSGVRNVNAKLSDEKVIMIRRWYNSGFKSQQELAEIFEVKKNTINCVVNGKTWNHI